MAGTAPRSSNRPGRGVHWPEWGLYLLAVVALAIYGVQWLRWQRGRAAPEPVAPTGEVMAELEPGDRIEMEPGAAAGCNVLLITMDTTRADHLGCYGHRGVETPVIDGLAREGVLFANAFTSSPSTLPGHATILTGLYPYRHGARANGTYRLAGEHTTLAEVLRAAGYATGAFVSAYVLDSRFGLDQGFDVYDDDLSQGVKYSEHMFRERPAQYASEAALSWLETLDEGTFFAWVHYFDPHAPYFPPEPFRSTYATRPYDGEIAYMDREIGALLSGLAEQGRLDETLIVVASDHGEGLGEHGEETHSLLVYDATLHTPLIISPPAGRPGPRGTVIDRQVSNVDIVPTILDLLGIDGGVPFDGASLAAAPQAHDDSIYAETISTLVLHGWSPLFAVRRQDAKYIHAPRPELYDLAVDPRELDNVFTQRPEPAAALSRVLDEHIGDDRFGAEALAQQVQMDPETARNLAALGYVGSVSTGSAARNVTALPDPKDMVPHWERIQAAENNRARGNFAEALAELEACLEAVPQDVWTMRLLVSAYLERGDLDRSEAMARRVLEIERNEPSIYVALGRVAMLQLRLAEAEAHFNRALEIDPDFAPAYVALGNLAALTAGPRRALEHFHRAIEMDPGTTGPGAWCAIGQMHLARLDLEPAREAFRNALAIDPLGGQAHSGLALVLIEENRLDEAEAEMEAAMRFHPNDVLVLATLAGLHNKKKEHDQAIALARRALDINEHSLRALNALGSALQSTGDLEGAAAALDHALERSPTFVPCLINRGQVYLAQRREEDAARLFERALEVNPTQPVALLNLGTYKVSRGKNDEALALYRRAVAADPDYALAHRQLGMLLLLGDDPLDALPHLERSLELEPDQVDRERIVELIEGLRQVEN
jgi:arylsulfatase A-like enzyme/tetratricopeptide (TPR) repeat protein